MQVKNKFTVFITMESDWHIGSGAGIPGNVDRLVIRDSDGFPYIPAKALTGIWRDACEQVALGLDGGNESGTWNKYVQFLFGDQPSLNKDSLTLELPISAALVIRPATLPQEIKKTILSRKKEAQQALKDAITFIKASNSINRQTGCTEEKFLRYEELVRLGSRLKAECTLNLDSLPDENQKQTALALLIAGAKFVEKLGGKRRRGAGKCTVQVEQEHAAEWINWIDKTYVKKEIEPPEPKFERETSQSNTSNSQNQAQTNGTWVKIPLTITTKLPVIIKNRTVGNVVETLDYIPGSNLLPIIAKKLGKLGFDVGKAIANKDLIITNATIQINKQPGKPVPLALYYEKMNGGFKKGRGIYNKFRDAEPEQQLKPYRQGYIGFGTDNQPLPDYTEVNKIIQTHNTIEDKSQRPTEEIGGIYSYQAIESGTVLCAELRIKKSVFPENIINSDSTKKEKKGKRRGKRNKGNKNTQRSTDNFLARLKTELDSIFKSTETIGTSKKDDYGLVEITVGQPDDQIDKNSGNQEAYNKLIVWLLSDTLVRNHNLRPTISVDDFQEVLQRELNIKLTSLDKVFIRQRRTESWQKRWSLPRPSLVGLMAGSCMEFIVQGNLDPDILHKLLSQLEITGIGERTVEGYGQLCFNHSLLTRKLSSIERFNNVSIIWLVLREINSMAGILLLRDFLNHKNEENEEKQTERKVINKNNSYAQIIEKLAWRNAIAQAALTLASKPDEREKLLGIRISKGKSCPSMNQLGNLRSQIRQLQQYDDSEVATQWIASIIEKDQGKKWEETADGLNKIKELVENEHLIWQKLTSHLNICLSDLTLTEGARESLREKLWAEAIKTAVYECIRAHKRDVEKQT